MTKARVRIGQIGADHGTAGEMLVKQPKGLGGQRPVVMHDQRRTFAEVVIERFQRPEGHRPVSLAGEDVHLVAACIAAGNRPRFIDGERKLFRVIAITHGSTRYFGTLPKTPCRSPRNRWRTIRAAERPSMPAPGPLAFPGSSEEHK